jgi:hypothetical protein
MKLTAKPKALPRAAVLGLALFRNNEYSDRMTMML